MLLNSCDSFYDKAAAISFLMRAMIRHKNSKLSQKQLGCKKYQVLIGEECELNIAQIDNHAPLESNKNQRDNWVAMITIQNRAEKVLDSKIQAQEINENWERSENLKKLNRIEGVDKLFKNVLSLL